MDTNPVQLRGTPPPEYVASCVGRPDFGSIANRLKEMAAFVSAQGLTDVAEHLSCAYGTLLARIAACEVVPQQQARDSRVA